jgi:hypothetical protein
MFMASRTTEIESTAAHGGKSSKPQNILDMSLKVDNLEAMSRVKMGRIEARLACHLSLSVVKWHRPELRNLSPFLKFPNRVVNK